MRLLVCIAALVFALPALAQTTSTQEDETFATLLSWAVSLSHYPAADRAPTVAFVSQQFFDDEACGGRHCHVWGWYPNTGQDVVYIRDDLRPILNDASDPRSLLAASIVVHEFVHYLQAAHRNFAPYDCREVLQLEREAYQLQTAYLQSYGRYFPVGLSMHHSSCTGSASEGVRQPVAP